MIFSIDNHIISNNNPVFIIAELSANHNQNYKLAVESIKAIKKTGADAIKLQTYTPDTITLKSNKKYFQIKQGTIWDGTTLYKLYGKAYTPWEWQPDLKKIANDLGLSLFSSPFDFSAVDFLEKIDMPAYKIASYEITDIPLIEYVASKGKPVIISTGIAYMNDIKAAIRACLRKGNRKIALLKCTSAYPTPFDEINLNTIPDLKKKFGTIVGLSDHSLGISVPIASTVLGAKIIEKHFILDRKLGGPDASFSLEPYEFTQMVKSVREVEKALGRSNYKLSNKIIKAREHSRSLFVVRNIKRGELFTTENVKSIRPGYGLHPKYLKNVIGKKAKTNIERGEPLKNHMIG